MRLVSHPLRLCLSCFGSCEGRLLSRRPEHGLLRRFRRLCFDIRGYFQGCSLCRLNIHLLSSHPSSVLFCRRDPPRLLSFGCKACVLYDSCRRGLCCVPRGCSLGHLTPSKVRLLCCSCGRLSGLLLSRNLCCLGRHACSCASTRLASRTQSPALAAGHLLNHRRRVTLLDGDAICMVPLRCLTRRLLLLSGTLCCRSSLGALRLDLTRTLGFCVRLRLLHDARLLFWHCFCYVGVVCVRRTVQGHARHHCALHRPRRGDCRGGIY